MQRLTAFPFTSKLTYDDTGWPQLDRAVTSEVLRNVLKNYYTNGVFGIADSTCLQVSATSSGSVVSIKPGVGLINGATGYTDTELTLDLEANNDTLPRIDTVVLRLNDNIEYRGIYLDIIKGTPATLPTAPVLTQTDSIWEIGLANITRPAHSSVISNSQITDTRADSSRCGYVTAIERLDTASLMQQLNAWYEEFVTQADKDYSDSREQYLEKCQEIVKSLLEFESSTKSEIMDWFERMRDQLSEDAAIHLQEEIDKKLDKTGDASNTTVTFDQAKNRENIESKDTQSTIMGKIAKFFADLKNVAFTGSYNDLADKPETDVNVTQTNTTTSADYRLLFSNTADDTTRTEGARKSSKFKANPSSGKLTATAFAGKTGESTIDFTSNDTTDANATSWTSVTQLATGITHATFAQKISQMFKNVRYLKKMYDELNSNLTWEYVSPESVTTGCTLVIRRAGKLCNMYGTFRGSDGALYENITIATIPESIRPIVANFSVIPHADRLFVLLIYADGRVVARRYLNNVLAAGTDVVYSITYTIG